MTTQNQPTPGSSSEAASEWELAAAKLTKWAAQMSYLAGQYQWFEARTAAEVATKASQLARSASKATGKKAARLRKAAAAEAQSASFYASGVISRLDMQFMQTLGTGLGRSQSSHS